MRYQKSAFTLIELLITLMIASFLIMTLNSVLQQSAKARQFVDYAVGNGFFRTTLYNELFFDFSGMIVVAPKQGKDEKKEDRKPPISIKRSPEDLIEEFRFLTTNARAYKNYNAVVEVVYTLDLVDKTKNLYALSRSVSEVGKEKKEERKSIQFLDTVVSCDLSFVKVKKGNQTEKQQPMFEIVREWPLQEKKDKKPEQKKEEKELEAEKESPEISYVQITIVYVKSRHGALETIAMLLPLYNTKPIPEEQVAQEKPKQSEKKSDELPTAKPTTSPFSKNEIDQEEDLLVLEKRTAKLLGSIFNM